MLAFHFLVLLSVAYLSLFNCDELKGPGPGSLPEDAMREGKERPKERSRLLSEDVRNLRGDPANVDRRRAPNAFYGYPSMYGSRRGYYAYNPYGIYGYGGGYNAYPYGIYGYGGGYAGNIYGYPYY